MYVGKLIIHILMKQGCEKKLVYSLKTKFKPVKDLIKTNCKNNLVELDMCK